MRCRLTLRRLPPVGLLNQRIDATGVVFEDPEPHDTVATAEDFTDFPPAHAAQQTAHGSQTHIAALVGRRFHRGLDLLEPRIVGIGSDFNLPQQPSSWPILLFGTELFSPRFGNLFCKLL